MKYFWAFVGMMVGVGPLQGAWEGFDAGIEWRHGRMTFQTPEFVDHEEGRRYNGAYKMRWDGIHMVSATFTSRSCWNNVYGKLDLRLGVLTGGNVRSTDYLFFVEQPEERVEVGRSHHVCADGGQGYINGGLGYTFCFPRWHVRLRPMIGFSGQIVGFQFSQGEGERRVLGDYYLPAEEEIRDDDASSHWCWIGPWVGFDIEVPIDCNWTVRGKAEWSVGINGHAHLWPLRDREEFDFFAGVGRIYELSAQYNFGGNRSVGVRMGYERWKTVGFRERFYFPADYPARPEYEDEGEWHCDSLRPRVAFENFYVGLTLSKCF